MQTKMKKNILLVEPKFPILEKSRNHKDYLPIGLLKLATYYRRKGHRVKLVIGNNGKRGFAPDEIKITSLFTYWSKYVWGSVRYYKKRYPEAKITVGGIYAMLMPEHCKMSGCDEVFTHVHKEADKCPPAYDLVDVDYQIIHASRGCPRRCEFCGVHKLEPKFAGKKSIKKEIHSNKLVFYDNNLNANPHFKKILEEIADAKYNGKPVSCESQCGFDYRSLTPELAKLMTRARFMYPKIAWDGPYSQHQKIKEKIDLLIGTGYARKDLSIFMLDNWKLDFSEMEKKRIKCWEWKVQISDCRYRPLNQTYDNYNPIQKQTNKDYYIHPSWTDAQVKQFRRNVRRQNICVRHGFPYHSESRERKKRKTKNRGQHPKDAWDPSKITLPEVDILKRLK